MARCELGYERVGAGPPIVVLNGFAATRADWDPGFIEALSAGNELVLLDNRGFGESGPAEEEFTVEEMAGDVAGAIEALGLERPCVLGWSMGGYVALSLTLTHPKLAGSLVLLSTSAGADSASASDEVAERLHDLSGTPREQATRLISVLFTPQRAPEVDAEFGDLVAEARAQLDHGLVERQWRAMEGWWAAGASGRLGEIGCPALVATGAEDVVSPPENATVLANGIEGSWLARFPRSGHAVMADHPVTLAGVIGAFLRAQGDW